MKAILLFCAVITVSIAVDDFKSPKSVKHCVRVSFIQHDFKYFINNLD